MWAFSSSRAAAAPHEDLEPFTRLEPGSLAKAKAAFSSAERATSSISSAFARQPVTPAAGNDGHSPPRGPWKQAGTRPTIKTGGETPQGTPKKEQKTAPNTGSDSVIRTLELLRAKFIQVLEIDAIKQTFRADVFYEFKIRGGAHDPDLTREGNGPPSTFFPQDTLRPSARWYLNQIEFSNAVLHHVHNDTCVVTRGDDIHLRFRAVGEFSEQLELEDFPFDTQELTVKLIAHCILGGAVGVEFVPPDFRDDYSVGPQGQRVIPRAEYNLPKAVGSRATPPNMSRHLHTWTCHGGLASHLDMPWSARARFLPSHRALGTRGHAHRHALTRSTVACPCAHVLGSADSGTATAHTAGPL